SLRPSRERKMDAQSPLEGKQVRLRSLPTPYANHRTPWRNGRPLRRDDDHTQLEHHLFDREGVGGRTFVTSRTSDACHSDMRSWREESAATSRGERSAARTRFISAFARRRARRRS